MSKYHVLDLGGSVAFAQQLKPEFLHQFADLIGQYVRRGHRFVIVAGGGYMARSYQNAARLCGLRADDLDWLGIAASRVNAIFLQKLFAKLAPAKLFDQREAFKEFEHYKIIIGCGWRPGWSTDFVAFQIAKDFGLSQIVVLGKADHVYSADFEHAKLAKPYIQLDWRSYQRLIPKVWQPGLRVPVDPIAASLARKAKLTAIVTKADDLANLRAILDGHEYRGTTISG